MYHEGIEPISVIFGKTKYTVNMEYTFSNVIH